MDFYEKLEFDKLIKELDFIDSDLNYKFNILKKADEDFMRNVNSVLDDFPKLRELLDSNNNKRLVNIPEPVVNQNVEEIGELITESKPTKLKNLYRQIAKSTHPDKTKQDNLNEVYLDAQKAYETNNIIKILSICEKLKIQYDITVEEVDLIKEEIETKKQRINFLESTYTWKWYMEQSIETKVKIILNYLEAQLIR
jgi:hypothetical protein